jgi:hypothetical protein
MEAVMQAKRRLGYQARDVSAERQGSRSGWAVTPSALPNATCKAQHEVTSYLLQESGNRSRSPDELLLAVAP